MRRLRTFANKNIPLCLEICSLNELGYPLEQNQRDLTLTQKLFLIHAYPIFNQKKQENNNSDGNGQISDPNKSYRERKLEENRRKHEARQKQIMGGGELGYGNDGSNTQPRR